ncbi:hypothetical protein C2845_PM16G04440 [Panicum miliaceum]|uniref:Late embryogenesis abundant protein LEA-2 subgroup domain-containing protein n=1 Tax=Panicum miliaceum TaxID=4540 RepID=A0A3L6PU43_PANMI|nr:hypothetical protein C2845_PM16G04440 [Panicum miliaceum]
MEADGGGGDKPSRLQCLNVTRYVVAAVMTVLVVGVTFSTVNLLIVYRRFHRDPLYLSVVRGTVYVRRAPATHSPPALAFYIGVRVSSARAINYFHANGTAYLFDGNAPPPRSSKDLERAAAIVVSSDSDQGRPAKAVQQEAQYYFLMEVKATRGTMKASYFDALYGGGGGGGGSSLNILTSLRLEGTFVTELRSGGNTIYPWSTYDCWPLIVTEDSNEAARYNDVRCIQRVSGIQLTAHAG